MRKTIIIFESQIFKTSKRLLLFLLLLITVFRYELCCKNQDQEVSELDEVGAFSTLSLEESSQLHTLSLEESSQLHTLNWIPFSEPHPIYEDVNEHIPNSAFLSSVPALPLVKTLKQNISYNSVVSWRIDEFGQQLPDDYGQLKIFKSPIIEVWWSKHTKIEVTLIMIVNSRDYYSGKFKISCEEDILNQGNSKIGTYNFCIYYTNGTYSNDIILYNGYHFESDDIFDTTISWGDFEVLNLNMKIEFILDKVDNNVVPSASDKIFREKLASVKDVEAMSDLTISVHGNKDIKANKIILAAVSPVFKVMFEHDFQECEPNSVDFQHDFKECKTNVVEIKDFKEDTVQNFLDYAYKGKIEDFTNLESALKLYHFAEKYKVDPLKKLCRKYIYSKISDEESLDEILCFNSFKI